MLLQAGSLTASRHIHTLHCHAGRNRSQPHTINAVNQAADMNQDDISGDDASPTEQANSYPDRDGSAKGDVSRNARQMMQNKAAQQRYRYEVTAASGGVCFSWNVQEWAWQSHPGMHSPIWLPRHDAVDHFSRQ